MPQISAVGIPTERWEGGLIFPECFAGVALTTGTAVSTACSCLFCLFNVYLNPQRHMIARPPLLLGIQYTRVDYPPAVPQRPRNERHINPIATTSPFLAPWVV